MQTLAVIFDMDGVLVDSYHAHFVSWQRFYGELGIAYSEEQFAADFGRTSRDILRRSLGDNLRDEQVVAWDTRKEAIYRELLRESFPAMDGAVELLQALKLDGFRLAIGSSGPPENVALVVEQLAAGVHFDATVTGADVTRGKPDPQVFQIAAERVGVAPAGCAVVEDAVHGITAAKRAGMTAIGLTGTLERDELSAADAVVDSLRQLSAERIRALVAAHDG
ncbi:MAG: HAD family hydrolase [Pirellulales bacterium]